MNPVVVCRVQNVMAEDALRLEPFMRRPAVAQL